MILSKAQNVTSCHRTKNELEQKRMLIYVMYFINTQDYFINITIY